MREIKKALKGGIIRASYENNDFLDALYWDDYIIAFTKMADCYSLYLKNGKEVILGLTHDETDQSKDYPLLRPVDGVPKPPLNALFNSINSDNTTPLKRPDYEAIWHYRVDFSDPERIRPTLEINEPGKEPVFPEPTPQDELDIEEMIFQELLKMFYGEVLMSQTFYLIQEGFRLNLPGVTDHAEIINLLSGRNEKKKWYPDYISALNEAGKLIDELAEQLKDYTPPDDDQEPELPEETPLPESGADNASGSAGELMSVKQELINISERYLTMQNKAAIQASNLNFEGNISTKKITGKYKNPKSKGKETSYVTTVTVEKIQASERINDVPEKFLSVPISEKTRLPLSEDVEEIYSAIITLIDNHIRMDPGAVYGDNQCSIPITVNQIYRATGAENNPTEEEKYTILKTIDQLINTWVTINFAQEFEARGIEYDEGIVARKLLEADLVKIFPKKAGKKSSRSRNHQAQLGIVVRGISPPYWLSKQTRQITYTPYEWIEGLVYRDGKTGKEKKIGNNQPLRILKKVIACRIQRSTDFRNAGSKDYNKSHYNTLVVDDLIVKAGKNPDDSRQRRRYAEAIERILTAMKEQKKIISTWKAEYRNGKIYAYKFKI